MKLLRKITGIAILIPFFLSVSGILIIHSHCNCTGLSQTSLFVAPESCESWHDEHVHLFIFQEHENQFCCHAVHSAEASVNSEHDPDCGCEDPEVNFFKLKNHFTEEKISVAKELIDGRSQTIIAEFNDEKELTEARVKEIWVKYPPPCRSSYNTYIHFICQSKILPVS